jgi:DNA processing protein
VESQPSIFEFAHQAHAELGATAQAVLAALDPDPVPIDLLCDTLHTDAGTLAGALLELELNGLVRQHPGKLFSRVIR